MTIERSCPGPCRLYAKCQTGQIYEQERIDQATADITLGEIETSTYTDSAQALDEAHRRRVELTKATLADNPEGLEEALQALSALYDSLRSKQAEIEKMHDDRLEAYRRDLARASLRLELYNQFLNTLGATPCTGPANKRSGFLWHEKWSICMAPVSSTLRSQVAETIKTDETFVKNDEDGMFVLDNLRRLRDGEYGI